MASYLTEGVLVYLDHLGAWETYFHHKKGDSVDVESEREALRGVLATCAEVCAEIEPEARAGWERAAELRDGQVEVPPHIQRGYERLREAGLVSLSIDEQYGGFDLPSLVANVVLQMVSRYSVSIPTQ